METPNSGMSVPPFQELKTSSEVELMETRCRWQPHTKLLLLKTSSEVELMETRQTFQKVLQSQHSKLLRKLN